MKIKIKNPFFFIMIFFILPDFALAAPSIGGVSGNLVHGTGIVISGSGFGIKEIAAPLFFDTFENGIEGEQLLENSRWDYAGNTCDVKFSSFPSRSNSSILAAKTRLLAGTYNGKFQTNAFSGQIGRKLISFWVYNHLVNLHASGDWQHKMWRIEAGPSHGDYPNLSLLQWYDAETGTNSAGSGWYYEQQQMRASNYNETYHSNPGIYGEHISRDEWVNVVVEIQDSSDVDVNDGVIKIKTFRGGIRSIGYFDDAVVTRTVSYPGVLSYIKLGYILENGVSPDMEMETTWDDIYVDNSWARVELCDNAIYTATTHCEIQPAISWLTSLIDFTLNQGSFNNGDTAYLYVVDSAGTTNADGFPITFGVSGGDTIAPESPSGLAVW